MTVPILFNIGAYGTYLEWCLTSLSTSDELSSPFRANGNSHNFQGTHLDNMQGWRQYQSGPYQSKFVRFHPKNEQNHSLQDHLEEILQSVDQVIFLYPDTDSVLLNMNNWFHKVWDDWWTYLVCSEIDSAKLYQNWPINPGTAVHDIDLWIRREFLSQYLVPSWRSQVEWYFPDSWQSPKCQYILVKDLLHDFENTITSIADFLKLDVQRPISTLLPYHEQNIKLQKYIDQDKICNHIIDSILHDEVKAWNALPIVSEAWIQWKLRELGYEIRCHGLDTFPTTSVQLKELLYTP
jgi:hypothetical protein